MRRGDFAAAYAASDAVLARRTGVPDDPALPYHLRFVWDGRALAGRRVLVRCYHGLGDTLQFCRFLPPLRRVAAQVTLEVQPALLDLMRAIPGIDRLHPFDPAHPLPPGEVDLEIMELGHALRHPTSWPDLIRPSRAGGDSGGRAAAPAVPPAPGPRVKPVDDVGGGRGRFPYLHADPMPGPPARVGFCWRGGGWDPARDLDLVQLVPLLALPGLHPVSLQRGPGGDALPDPLGGSMDVGRLAGLVAGLAAVVTVDTMVAHLAGALGRPVFLLLKHHPDWRWGAEGAWYPSVRSFRQDADGSWAGAVDRLGTALHATLAGARGL